MSCSIHEAITRIIINIDVECKSTVTISQFLSFLDDLFINVPHAFFFIFFYYPGVPTSLYVSINLKSRVT
jgi:hypothetical protein